MILTKSLEEIVKDITAPAFKLELDEENFKPMIVELTYEEKEDLLRTYSHKQFLKDCNRGIFYDPENLDEKFEEDFFEPETIKEEI